MPHMKKTKSCNLSRHSSVFEKPVRDGLPNFRERMKRIFGKKKLKVSGLELIAKDREERF
jgi:hypothetical protein